MRLLPIAVLLLAYGSAFAPAGATADSAAQTAASPRFDIASVKPCVPDAAPQGRAGGAGAGGTSVGSVTFNCARPANLIYIAYVVNGSQPAGDPMTMWVGRNAGTQFAPGANDQRIRGGPAWAYTERFTIEAKAPGPSDMKTMQGAMLRALLEERFHVKVHQETEEVPMWALTVAKSGPKLKAPVPGNCVALEISQPLTREIVDANPGKVFCDKWIASEFGQSRTVRFGGQSLSRLAETISGDLGVKVLDETGLSGTFDFILEYALDDDTTNNGRPRTEPAPPSKAVSIFTALQDQLGLKLVKTKGTRGFLVIDHIERPGPDFAAGAATSGKPPAGLPAVALAKAGVR